MSEKVKKFFETYIEDTINGECLDYFFGNEWPLTDCEVVDLFMTLDLVYILKTINTRIDWIKNIDGLEKEEIIGKLVFGGDFGDSDENSDD
jgi:hypothetical protein